MYFGINKTNWNRDYLLIGEWGVIKKVSSSSPQQILLNASSHLFAEIKWKNKIFLYVQMTEHNRDHQED